MDCDTVNRIKYLLRDTFEKRSSLFYSSINETSKKNERLPEILGINTSYYNNGLKNKCHENNNFGTKSMFSKRSSYLFKKANQHHENFEKSKMNIKMKPINFINIKFTGKNINNIIKKIAERYRKINNKAELDFNKSMTNSKVNSYGKTSQNILSKLQKVKNVNSLEETPKKAIYRQIVHKKTVSMGRSVVLCDIRSKNPNWFNTECEDYVSDNCLHQIYH